MPDNTFDYEVPDSDNKADQPLRIRFTYEYVAPERRRYDTFDPENYDPAVPESITIVDAYVGNHPILDWLNAIDFDFTDIEQLILDHLHAEASLEP